MVGRLLKEEDDGRKRERSYYVNDSLAYVRSRVMADLVECAANAIFCELCSLVPVKLFTLRAVGILTVHGLRVL